HQVGEIVPVAEVHAAQANNWQALHTTAVYLLVHPEPSSQPTLIAAGEALREKEEDVIMLD
ncbi:AroM family protein, partial [Salmonella enterica]|uniref:AroM family protein n=1 Tax=Salmonella enterica TaxID=28901 RepID=UPI000ACCF3A4